jgi:hypothetical protein
MELTECLAEVHGVELGPHARRENQFGVGAFPEQEVAEALLAAGADEQVHRVGSTEELLEALRGDA